MQLLNTSVLILGLGHSGLAMARWCARHGAHVTVADTREAPPQLADLQRDVPAAQFVAGEFGAGLIDGHLLEARYQLAGTAQVTHQDVGGRLRVVDKLLQHGAAQIAGGNGLVHDMAMVLQGAGGHYAVADWGVEFVGNAGDQGTKRGEFFTAHQLVLRLLQGCQGLVQLQIALAQGIGAQNHPLFEGFIEVAIRQFGLLLLGDIHIHTDKVQAAAGRGNAERGALHVQLLPDGIAHLGQIRAKCDALGGLAQTGKKQARLLWAKKELIEGFAQSVVAGNAVEHFAGAVPQQHTTFGVKPLHRDVRRVFQGGQQALLAFLQVFCGAGHAVFALANRGDHLLQAAAQSV